MTVGIVGYDFGDIGLRALVGVELMNIDQRIVGSVQKEGGQPPLQFIIDMAMETTQFLAGVYWEFNPRWNFAGIVGAGGQKTKRVTAQLGYRF